MQTYHGKDGKFCHPESARTVTKGGERFRVVRQHRRIGPRAGAVSLDLKRAVEAKGRARIGEMRGWVPLGDVISEVLR